MKARWFLFLAFAALSPRVDGENAAVRPTSGAWGTGDRYQQLLKKGKAARVRGNVLSMEDLVPYEGMEPGVQIRVRGDAGDLFVHLGPRWFLLERDVTFTCGEPLVIVGVKIRFEGKPTVIATEVERGKNRVILREPSGRPSWSPGAGHRVEE